jgi:hypothetical protein
VLSSSLGYAAAALKLGSCKTTRKEGGKKGGEKRRSDGTGRIFSRLTDYDNERASELGLEMLPKFRTFFTQRVSEFVPH